MSAADTGMMSTGAADETVRPVETTADDTIAFKKPFVLRSNAPLYTPPTSGNSINGITPFGTPPVSGSSSSTNSATGIMGRGFTAASAASTNNPMSLLPPTQRLFFPPPPPRYDTCDVLTMYGGANGCDEEDAAYYAMYNACTRWYTRCNGFLQTVQQIQKEAIRMKHFVKGGADGKTYVTINADAIISILSQRPVGGIGMGYSTTSRYFLDNLMSLPVDNFSATTAAKTEGDELAAVLAAVEAAADGTASENDNTTSTAAGASRRMPPMPRPPVGIADALGLSDWSKEAEQWWLEAIAPYQSRTGGSNSAISGNSADNAEESISPSNSVDGDDMADASACNAAAASIAARLAAAAAAATTTTRSANSLTSSSETSSTTARALAPPLKPLSVDFDVKDSINGGGAEKKEDPLMRAQAIAVAFSKRARVEMMMSSSSGGSLLYPIMDSPHQSGSPAGGGAPPSYAYKAPSLASTATPPRDADLKKGDSATSNPNSVAGSSATTQRPRIDGNAAAEKAAAIAAAAGLHPVPMGTRMHRAGAFAPTSAGAPPVPMAVPMPMQYSPTPMPMMQPMGGMMPAMGGMGAMPMPMPMMGAMPMMGGGMMMPQTMPMYPSPMQPMSAMPMQPMPMWGYGGGMWPAQ